MAMGVWNVSPSEFWNMTPMDFWLIYDGKKLVSDERSGRMKPSDLTDLKDGLRDRGFKV